MQDKIVLHMFPDYGNALFWNAKDECCGDFHHVSFSVDYEDTEVDLTSIPELEDWFWEWERHTLWEQNYSDDDWNVWKARGLAIAKKVAELLPDYVELYYLWDSDKLWTINPKGTDDGGVFYYGDPKKVSSY